MTKFDDSNSFDWNNLGQLVRCTKAIEPALIAANCVKGYAFLNELDPVELELAESSHHYKLALWKMLGDDLPVSRN